MSARSKKPRSTLMPRESSRRAGARSTRPSRPTVGEVDGSAHERALGQSENRARDHEPLDLARALVDLGDLGVAVVALDRELLRVAVAAEDLDRLGRLPARHLGGIELRLGA